MTNDPFLARFIRAHSFGELALFRLRPPILRLPVPSFAPPPREHAVRPAVKSWAIKHLQTAHVGGKPQPRANITGCANRLCPGCSKCGGKPHRTRLLFCL